MERKLITKFDVIATTVILIFAVAMLLIFHFTASENVTAVITVDGAEVERINLSDVTEEKIISLDNGIKIKSQDGKICFAESDCRDKICVNSGELSREGEVAACVPNKTVIYIAGNSAVDVITY